VEASGYAALPHMNLATQPRGSCPGVWAPMESGDGLIARLRPRWARLDAARLRAVARLASENGSGIVELTRRANLQIRGGSLQTWPRLRDELVRLGLAPSTPEAETRPALLVCPLSGLDARSAPLEPLAAELDALLEQFSTAGKLSHKFGIVLSGGSRLSGDVAADLHVRLHPDHPGFVELICAGTAESGVSLGACRESEAPVVVRRLLEALAQKGAGRRMRDAVGGVAREALVSAVQHSTTRVDTAPGWGSSLLGLQTGARSWFGFGVPFGSASAEAWVRVAELAEQFGASELRLTPARQVLLLGVNAAQAMVVGSCLERDGFVTREREHDVELEACSGAPACRSALGDTRALAREIAELLGPLRGGRISVNVSGCDKSCARDAAADVTVVRSAGGCHLGFGTDVKSARATPPFAAAAIGPHLVAHFSTKALPAPRTAGSRPSA